MEYRVIRLLQEEKWRKLQDRCLRFLLAYGDQRITKEALELFESLSAKQLQQADNQLALAIHRPHSGPFQLRGVSYVQQYGLECCIIVVHPDARGQGIGTMLMMQHIEQLGSLSCQVAVDNLSSLSMCFQAGLTAHRIFTGPTGKPTLAFDYIARR